MNSCAANSTSVDETLPEYDTVTGNDPTAVIDPNHNSTSLPVEPVNPTTLDHDAPPPDTPVAVTDELTFTTNNHASPTATGDVGNTAVPLPARSTTPPTGEITAPPDAPT